MIFSTTPSFLTLAGLEIQIGSLKDIVKMSMGSSVPTGIDLELQVVRSSSTTLRLVQSR